MERERDPQATQRRAVSSLALTESDFGPDPLATFAKWIADATLRETRPNVNAMTLCTVGADGAPQGRIVLLKGHDARGFCFFTNRDSEKGLALQAKPLAELVFHWDSLGRQIRARGAVERLTDAEDDSYFASRPRDSQIGAWASKQSQPIADRAALDAAFEAAQTRFASGPVPRPPHWGGYRLLPQRIEFWQLAKARFHDRFVYTRDPTGAWRLDRLNP